MIVQASVSGLIRTVLIILGTFVLLRFIGQLMIAKRNIEEERKLKAAQDKFDKDLENTKANFGKTSVISASDTNNAKPSKSSSTIEDVDFEEVS